MHQRRHIHKSVFESNDQIAEQIQKTLNQHGITAINMISSPGAGKTTILEETIDYLSDQNVQIGVIEGDIATTLDAERIARHGVRSVQINTHGACHLDAAMIQSVLSRFPLNELDLLFIENVGNLVCPTEFELGEHLRIAVLSTTEGADKVVKYPSIFKQADAVLLNKFDLLPYIPFDVAQFSKDLDVIKAGVPLMKMSALKGEGIKRWGEWILEKLEKRKYLKGKD